MGEYKRFILLIVIMAGVALIIGATSIGILYQTSVDQQRDRLAEMAQSQARLLEAMARSAERTETSPGSVAAATLAQVTDAYERLQIQGLGNTGEFTLAKREGDSIVFVLRQRHSEDNQPDPVAIRSGLAEPMRRALSGASGTIIGQDYRGETVLAAHEPVGILNLGIVAKIDLAEIHEPFFKAGGAVLAIAMITIAGGAALFFRVGEPIIRQVRLSESRFRELFENMSSGAAVYEPVGGGADFVLTDLNRGAEAIDHVRRQDLLGRRVGEGSARDTGYFDLLKRVWRTGQSEHYPINFFQSDHVSGWRKSFVCKLPSGEVVSLFEDVTEQKRTEETLRESEERFRSITETAGDAIISIDALGTVVLWNKAAERIFGYTEEEIVGQPLLSLVPERYRERHRIGLELAVEGGQTHLTGKTLEMEAVCKDGTELPVSLSVSTWTAAGSRYFTGIIRDISARRRNEQRLKESDARWRSLIESGSFGIVIVDSDYRIRFANQAAERLFGQTAESMNGRPFQHSLNDTEQVEIKIERSNGSIAFAEMQALPTYWDGKLQHLVIIKDASARKRAQRDVSKMFQAIEQSPSSVVITDVEGRIEYVNPKFSEVTGYGLAEVVGKNPRILKSGHTPPEEYERLWSTITAGQVWRGEFHNKKKNGNLFWEFASIAPVKDSRGQIVSFVCVKEDITQRKVTEDHLRQAQKMEAIGQLAGGLAHDFNNLLGIILGNLQLLQESEGLDAECRELVADALWSAQRGAELTHRLLAFGRRQALNPQVIDVNRIASGMVDLLRRTFGSNVKIRETLSADLWPALADRGEFERALVNLAVNARDAMPDGGTLTLETRNVVLDRAYTEEFEDVRQGAYVLFAMTDTGTGMSPETIERIFEPFFTTKGIGQGSGLGLSMVYGFVHQSGGHVCVYSAQELGTSVQLFLPQAKAAVAANEHAAAARDLAEEGGVAPGAIADLLDRKTVLVVEHDGKLRRIAVKMLNAMGMLVVAVDGSVEALQRLKDLPRIDLLFTDLTLDGSMTGEHLAAEATALRPGLRVAYASGFPRGSLHGYPTPTATPLILKPYSQRDLARAFAGLFATADA